MATIEASNHLISGVYCNKTKNLPLGQGSESRATVHYIKIGTFRWVQAMLKKNINIENSRIKISHKHGQLTGDITR